MVFRVCTLLLLSCCLAFSAELSFTPFALPGDQNETFGTYINDLGQIAGTYTQNSSHYGYLREANGTYTTLLFLGVGFGLPEAGAGSVSGLNDSGVVVGSLPNTGFRLAEGIATPIQAPDAQFTYANGINNLGQIVGTFDLTVNNDQGQGYVLSNGAFTSIDYPGAQNTRASSINDLGEVVGSFSSPGSLDFSGFSFKNGIFTAIDFPGSAFTIPAGVNDNGDIVGYYDDLSGLHGFLFSSGVYQTLDYPGAFMSSATGINNLGQISGYALSISNGNVESVGFVASTVPEPASCLLVGLAIPVFICARRAGLRSRRANPSSFQYVRGDTTARRQTSASPKATFRHESIVTGSCCALG